MFIIKYTIRLFILLFAIIGIAALIIALIFYFDPQNSLPLLETKKFILEETIQHFKASNKNKTGLINLKINSDEKSKDKTKTISNKPFPKYLMWDENAFLNKLSHVKKPNSLVFSGGGPRGVAYVGALHYLQETGKLKNIKRFIGTSAGSIMCTFMSFSDYYEKNREASSSEFWEIVQEIMLEANFMNFIDNPILQKTITGINTKQLKLELPEILESFQHLTANFAFCKGSVIVDFFKKSFEKLGIDKDVTFEELYKLTGKHLVLVSCSLSYRKTAYFDYRTAPDLSVATAMRASMAIPFVFEPVKYNDDSFVDGGASNNYPINYFDFTEVDASNPVSCLGFVLISKEKILKPEYHEVDNVGLYTTSVFKLLLENTSSALYSKNVNRTIFIDCGNIGTTSFDISVKEKQKLINAGYKATKKYFEEK